MMRTIKEPINGEAERPTKKKGGGGGEGKLCVECLVGWLPQEEIHGAKAAGFLSECSPGSSWLH